MIEVHWMFFVWLYLAIGGGAGLLGLLLSGSRVAFLTVPLALAVLVVVWPFCLLEHCTRAWERVNA